MEAPSVLNNYSDLARNLFLVVENIQNTKLYSYETYVAQIVFSLNSLRTFYLRNNMNFCDKAWDNFLNSIDFLRAIKNPKKQDAENKMER